jgi:hypothetical protein
VSKRLIEYMAELKPGRWVHVVVPVDLTVVEAKKVAGAVAKLASDTRGWIVRDCELSGDDV